MAVMTRDSQTLPHGITGIWQLLGFTGNHQVVKTVRSRFQAWRWINDHGLPSTSIKKLSSEIEIDLRSADGVMVFGMNPKTLQRRQKRHMLEPEDATTVFRISEVALQAFDAFGDRKKATRWLHKPCRALSGEIPLQMLRDDVGRGLVEDVLSRIKYGVYS